MVFPNAKVHIMIMKVFQFALSTAGYKCGILMYSSSTVLMSVSIVYLRAHCTWSSLILKRLTSHAYSVTSSMKRSVSYHDA